MDKKPDIFERIKQLFAENPKYFGVFLIIVGVFMIAAAICNWDWIFAGHSYNTQKIEGVANMWGRGFARIKFGSGGVVLVIGGVLLAILL